MDTQQENEPNHGFWFGWGIAIGLLLGGFISATAILTISESAKLCLADGTEICSREWLAAVGNWAGLLVAVPSVLLLWHQIRVGQGQHLRALQLQVKPAIERVREVTAIRDRFLSISEGGQKLMEESSPSASMALHYLNEMLYALAAADEFSKSSAVQGLEPVKRGRTRAIIEEIIGDLKTLESETFNREELRFDKLWSVFFEAHGISYQMNIVARREENHVRDLLGEHFRYELFR